jgi:hypothetical protein
MRTAHPYDKSKLIALATARTMRLEKEENGG